MAWWIVSGTGPDIILFLYNMIILSKADRNLHGLVPTAQHCGAVAFAMHIIHGIVWGGYT